MSSVCTTVHSTPLRSVPRGTSRLAAEDVRRRRRARARVYADADAYADTDTDADADTDTDADAESVADADAASIQFSSATYIEDESQVAVSRSPGPATRAGPNSVNFATSNGTATGGAACTAGVDYISVNQMVTFNPTITSQTVNVTMCADSLTEFPNQTVNLTLTGANLGSPSAAVLTINDTATQFPNPGPIPIGRDRDLHLRSYRRSSDRADGDRIDESNAV